ALLQQLAAGRHDAVILPGRIDQPELETALLLQESLHLVLPADHPLARKHVVSPDDMQGQTVLAMEPGHQLQEPVAELCRTTGAILARDYEGTTLDTSRQMVASG